MRPKAEGRRGREDIPWPRLKHAAGDQREEEKAILYVRRVSRTNQKNGDQLKWTFYPKDHFRDLVSGVFLKKLNAPQHQRLK